MEVKKSHILCTRPLDNALIKKATAKNILIDCVSFIETRPVVTSSLTTFIEGIATRNTAVAFTSMNAAEVVITTLQQKSLKPNWKIYCLPGATLSIIKNYFLGNIIVSAKNASALADQIIEAKPTEVVFFCGNLRREELPTKLAIHKIAVKEIVVYETLETPTHITATYNGILFFSPSAVESFFSNNTIEPHTTLFAIGDTTAQAIKNFSSNTTVISDFPGKEQLIEKVITYFNPVKHH
jgi:uroporphyrinogen-III synthase